MALSNLELRMDKSELMQSYVKYLGLKLSSDGIRAEAIQNFQTPL